MRFFVCVAVALFSIPAFGQETETLKVGIIGLDTSHSIAFTKSLNADPPLPEMKNCRVVAAYPYGSREIESSASRIPKYTEDIKPLGVEIVDSIEALLQQVDCVLLETNDGHPHLQQALEVFRAGKPVFIDKPVASNLSEVVAIYRAAKHYDAKMFSSSSLRFSSGPQAIRADGHGKVYGANSFSPCSIEPTHTELFWYGIHGVETLFTCMGKGCVSVSHTSTDDFELAVGTWSDGRIGTFRGIRKGKSGFGGTAFTAKEIVSVGKFDGYKPLVAQIAKFFRTGESPVDAAETIEIYAFMQSAQESKRRGERVTIAEVMAEAEKAADDLLTGSLE